MFQNIKYIQDTRATVTSATNLSTYWVSLDILMTKMRSLSALMCFAGLWPCLTSGFVNPIRTGSDPQMVYEDGM